jgi:hypothetical protein
MSKSDQTFGGVSVAGSHLLLLFQMTSPPQLKIAWSSSSRVGTAKYAARRIDTLLHNMQDCVNATRPPCRIVMTSVDIAAFIAIDDAEYLGDKAAVALIVGTAFMLRAVERKRRIRRAHGGSPQGCNPNRDRGMKEAGNLLDRQYFCRNGGAVPIFTDAEFERQFRMSHSTYETIRSAVIQQDPDFFEQRPDATGRCR